MNELSYLVSFLTTDQKPSCLQGWGLIRIESVDKYSSWKHQWIVIENGAIVWHVDDLKSAVNGAAVIVKSSVDLSDVIDQTDSAAMSFSCMLQNESTVTVSLGLSPADIPIWKAMIELHMSVADEATKLKYVGEILHGVDNFEEGTAAATMQVHLKGKPHTILVTPEDDVGLMADKFIEDNKLKPEIKSRIETELLKTQVDACLIHESKLRKLLNWTRRRASERVLLEERCFLAEKASAALVDSMAGVHQAAAQVQLKVGALNADVSEKGAKLDSMTDLLDATHDEIDRLTDANGQLSECAEELNAELAARQRQEEALSAQLAQEMQQSEAVRVQLSSMEADRAHAEEHCGQLQLEVGAAQEQLDVTAARYKDLMAKYDLLLLSNKRTAQRIRAGDRHTGSRGDDWDGEERKAMKAKYEERIKSLRAQVAAHDELKAQVQHKHDEALSSLQSTTVALRRGEDEVVRLRSENKDMRSRLQNSSPTKVTQGLSEENYGLRRQLEAARSEVQSAQQHTSEVEASAVATMTQVIYDVSQRFEATKAAQIPPEEVSEFLEDLLASLSGAAAEMQARQAQAQTEAENSTGTQGPFSPAGEGPEAPVLEPDLGSSLEQTQGQQEQGHEQEQEQEPGLKPMPDFTLREAGYSLITPIVEDRLLRSVYCKYVSDISGGMNITRMGRFAKEFGIVAYKGGEGVGSNAVATSANKPPFLTSGEVDMIYLNACKIETDGSVHSAWEEHMGVLSAGQGGVEKKAAPFNVRHAGSVIGGPSGNAPRAAGARGSKGHISPHQLSISQFVICMKAVATRLYSSLIEQQTGTILECLPPRQKEVATAAALEVLLKKKILPVAQVQGLVPWPLIFMDQTLTSINNSANLNSLLCGKMDVMVDLFYRYGSEFTISVPEMPTSDHQKLVEDRVDAIRSPSQKLNLSRKSSPVPLHHHNPNHHRASSVSVHALTYQQVSQLAHDVGIIPALVKEAEFFSQFEEIVLWCQTDTHLMLTALSNELLSFTTLFQEEVEWRSAQQRIRQQMKRHGEKKGGSVTHGPSQFPGTSTQLVVGMASLFILLTSVGVQAFSDVYPELRVERLFEWIAQSAHYTPGMSGHDHSHGQGYAYNSGGSPSPRRNIK